MKYKMFCFTFMEGKSKTVTVKYLREYTNTVLLCMGNGKAGTDFLKYT